jgi:hypothetical protein
MREISVWLKDEAFSTNTTTEGLNFGSNDPGLQKNNRSISFLDGKS